MEKVTAILSMLHESPDANSATRLFRREPVLRWTLRRLQRAAGIDGVTLLCWEDQAEAAGAAIAESSAVISSPAPRQPIAALDTLTASRRWADGWRGGLLGACEFDRGFYAPWISEIRRQKNAAAVLLVDPAAALVDPVLIEGVLRHWQARLDLDLCFAPAAPGLSGVLVAAPLLNQLSDGKSHPSVMMNYRPDSPRRDPISESACVSIPVELARTTNRFTFDSARQIARLTAATAHLNGQLFSIGAVGLLHAVNAALPLEEQPRELVMELNTDRATDPLYWPGRRLNIHRRQMTLQTARRLFDELAAMDDSRLVLAGVGDPLLHENVLEIIAAAHAAGINAISIETDFVGVPADRIATLAESAVDIVSVHFPATGTETYRTIMGIDAFGEVMNNVQLFVERRQARCRGLPLLAPTFMKCRQNQGEMEAWYDHWLRAVGCAVIAGPSDFSGMIPVVAAAEMAGPKRRPCASLPKRLMVLSDGSIASCEQDVLGKQLLGAALKEAWKNGAELRGDHQAENWEKHIACRDCKQWFRP